MPDITFIAADGTETGFEAPDGVSLMAAATGFGVPGILAEMGVGAIMQQQPPLDVKLEAIKRYAGQVIARFA